MPGDVKTKGTDFLAEAERHMKSNHFEKGSIVRLASLQATLLLYERCAVGANYPYAFQLCSCLQVFHGGRR